MAASVSEHARGTAFSQRANSETFQSPIYEKINHKDREFPVLLHISYLDSHINRVLTHWHEEAEILFVLEGEANCICNLETQLIKPGDVVYIGPNCLHTFENITSECVYECMLVNMDFIRPSCFSGANTPASFVTSEPEVVLPIKNIVEEIYQQKPWYQSVVQGQLITALAHMGRIAALQAQSAPHASKHFNEVRLAIEYIHEHFKEKITIEDICSVVGFSKTYFSERFHQATGKSIIEYINHFRCQYASHLLTIGKYSIGECADMSGFHSVSYFTRKYKQIYGRLPSEAKRQDMPLPDKTISQNPCSDSVSLHHTWFV